MVQRSAKLLRMLAVAQLAIFSLSIAAYAQWTSCSASCDSGSTSCGSSGTRDCYSDCDWNGCYAHCVGGYVDQQGCS